MISVIGLIYLVFGVVLAWIGFQGNMLKVSFKRLNVLLKFKLDLDMFVVYCTGLIFFSRGGSDCSYCTGVA